VWQAIAQLPGLNALRFWSGSNDALMPPSSLAQLSALAGLAGTLHTLEMLRKFDRRQQHQVVDYSALGSLSRLTAVVLPLAAERQGLGSISAQLQQLHLKFTAAEGTVQQVTLQPSELSALGQLAQLNRLVLVGTGCEDNAGWSFLSSLRQLEGLYVPSLPHAAVAALAHLTCLSKLKCGAGSSKTGRPRARHAVVLYASCL
jgi:hypothetical protein